MTFFDADAAVNMTTELPRAAGQTMGRAYHGTQGNDLGLLLPI